MEICDKYETDYDDDATDDNDGDDDERNEGRLNDCHFKLNLLLSWHAHRAFERVIALSALRDLNAVDKMMRDVLTSLIKRIKCMNGHRRRWRCRYNDIHNANPTEYWKKKQSSKMNNIIGWIDYLTMRCAKLPIGNPTSGECGGRYREYFSFENSSLGKSIERMWLQCLGHCRCVWWAQCTLHCNAKS